MKINLTDDGFELIGEILDFHLRKEKRDFILDVFQGEDHIESLNFEKLDTAIQNAFQLEHDYSLTYSPEIHIVKT